MEIEKHIYRYYIILVYSLWRYVCVFFQLFVFFCYFASCLSQCQTLRYIDKCCTTARHHCKWNQQIYRDNSPFVSWILPIAWWISHYCYPQMTFESIFFFVFRFLLQTYTDSMMWYDTCRNKKQQQWCFISKKGRKKTHTQSEERKKRGISAQAVLHKWQKQAQVQFNAIKSF